ncbi:8-amino-7-oxononanoate synthase [Quadrisphaera sp. DSM 44207]|nr:8-amino-7-oxononanoate synthase [Quadrisphaera sp. DSM 44207]
MARRDPFAPVVNDRFARQLRAMADPGPSPAAVPVSSASAPVTRFSDGVERVNLGSNNYLGLTTDPQVVAGAQAALDRYGTGACGSRMLNGTTDLHLALEAELADFYGVEAAVVTTSGFTANLALLSSVGRPGDALLVDSQAHASLQMGAGASRAALVRWRHNDLDALRAELEAVDPAAGVVVVVDGVYSMHGGTAPLPRIAALCRDAGARLVVDEAHGIGVLGERGRGAAEAAGVLDSVDAVTVTLSKALGSCGGAVLTGAAVAEGLRGAARPYVFATSNVPASLGASLAALRVLRADPERPRRVRALAGLLRRELELAGVPTLPGEAAVVAVPGGSTQDTLAAWRAVFARGVYVNAVIHPAVPRGEGLLRLSVMATHDERLVERAVAAVADGVRAARERRVAVLPDERAPALR